MPRNESPDPRAPASIGWWLARLNSAWAAVAITAVLYALFLGLRLHKLDNDVSRFVLAGDEFCAPAEVPAGLRVRAGSSGYDGQYYYRLALDPLTRRVRDFGITLDVPAYRQQRIGYPLLARLAALGRPERIPAAMVLVNFAGLGAVAYFAARYTQLAGGHALLGLLVSCYPGFVLTVARDLTEIAAAAFLLAGLVAFRRDRGTLAGLLLAAAVLCKETTLLAIVALAAAEVLATLRGRRAGAAAAGPGYWRTALAVLPGLVVFVAWQVFLRARWGVFPVLAGESNLGPPCAGLATFMQRVLAAAGPGAFDYWLGILIFLAVFTVCVLFALRSARSGAEIVIGWLLYGGLGLCLTDVVWVEHWAFLRALTEFYVLGALLLATSRMRALMMYVVYASLAWVTVMRASRG